MRVREMRRRGEVGRLCGGDLFCACTERRGTPVWSPYGEVWSRDVFVSLRELVIGCYNMYDAICKEFSHTAIISRTRSHLSSTDSAARGFQAARQLRSNSHSFRRKMRRAGRFVMRATVCGHHVRQRNDEKLADPRSDDLHIVG